MAAPTVKRSMQRGPVEPQGPSEGAGLGRRQRGEVLGERREQVGEVGEGEGMRVFVPTVEVTVMSAACSMA